MMSSLFVCEHLFKDNSWHGGVTDGRGGTPRRSQIAARWLAIISLMLQPIEFPDWAKQFCFKLFLNIFLDIPRFGIFNGTYLATAKTIVGSWPR